MDQPLHAPRSASPPLEPEERRALRAFWAAYAPRHDETRRAIRRAAEGSEALAGLFDEDASDAQAFEADRLALEEDRWEPLLDRMRQRGERYATREMSVEPWTALVRALRASVTPACRAHHGDDVDALCRALHGASLYVDRCVVALVDGYLARSERRLAEEAAAAERQRRELAEVRSSLEQVEERYEDLVATADEGVWAVNREGRTTYVNARMAELLGHEPARMLGTPVTDHVPARDVEGTRRHLAARLEGGRSQFAARFVHRDGHVVRVRINSRPIESPDGTIEGALALVSDDTERWRSSTALGAILEQLPATVWTTDAALRVTSYQRGDSDGDDRSRVLGRDLRQVLTDFEEGGTAIAAHERALTGETVHYRSTTPEGVYSATVKPLRGPGGAVEGTLGVALDVSEQDRLERRLRASQSLEAIGRLAGGVAHDFNNVLTVVQAHADLLERALAERPEREDAAAIRRAVHRASRLTRQLLAVGRRQAMRDEVVDVDAVLADLAEMIERLIGADVGLEIQRGAEGPHRARVDHGQLEQVILNLCVNARDAMPDGGRLVLETWTERVAPDPELGLDGGEHVGLAVTDTGHGMDEETRQRIFQAFFTTKGGKGSGLGLATVYGIVRQASGRIRVRSEPGRGARFEVLLPRSDRPATAIAPSTRPAPRRGGATRSVLVVEDDPLVRRAVKRTLKLAGHDVIAVEHADQAFDACRGVERIDVLLADLVMPGIGGRQLADRLATLHPETRAIFMSGYAEAAARERGLVLPGAPFLSKPFSADRLLEALECLEPDGCGPASSARP
ncbi:MAG TPA: response regulator [Sandaracinaceae bacterium LLY-WYZ-13_1]|nr:response regulator [Sandaracinaceae bacterium LLY-WYZ-13_1]